MQRVELVGVTVDSDVSDSPPVLVSLDLSVDGGKVTALLGASGSGKTTILRVVAGLQRPSSGTVRFGGRDVTRVEPPDRNVAFVFQQPVLFARRDVRRNISLPLEFGRRPADEIRKRVTAEARALHIESLLERKPSELSDGEAQVVQVARALVKQPDVLLLDEPFSMLDAGQTAQLRREFALIQRGFGVTTLLAANDPLDAMTMADDVAIVDGGRIVQTGLTADVYERPDTVAAALLTGSADVLDVAVEGDELGSWLVRAGLRVRVWAPAIARLRGRSAQLVVRPEWWDLDERGAIEADVVRVQRWTSTTSLWCRVGGQPMTVKLNPDSPTPAEGDHVRLRLRRFVVVDPSTGRRVELG